MLSPAPRNAVVKNAADPQQRNRAVRLERRRDARLRAALKVVMGSPEGRLVMWELLRTCGVYSSVWEASAKIHYNAGRQDVGHELLADLHDVAPELYLTMEREMRTLAKREQDEIDAGHLKPAEEHDNG